jgi:hypothetical protein
MNALPAERDARKSPGMTNSEALAACIAEWEARKSRAEINIQRNENQDDDENGEHDLPFPRHSALCQKLIYSHTLSTKLSTTRFSPARSN